MIQSEVISTDKSEIWIEEDGILVLRPYPHVEIDLEEVERCFAIYKQLGCYKKKKLQIIIADLGFTITADAREYVNKNGKNCFVASAMVSNSLAVRILVNFFNKFYRHEVPFRMFPDEKKAREWLEQFSTN